MNVCTFPGFADLKPTDMNCAVSTQSYQAPALSIVEPSEIRGHALSNDNTSTTDKNDGNTTNDNNKTTGKDNQTVLKDDTTTSNTNNTNTTAKTSTRTNSVKTGDTNNLYIWITLLAVSCVALAGLVVYTRRRRAK